MADYIVPNYTRKFSNPESFSLTYVDLMSDASNIYSDVLTYKYVKENVDEYGNILNDVSEEQQKINKLIESKTGFDVIFYSRIYETSPDNIGVFKSKIPDKHNSSHIKIGNYYLNTPYKNPREVTQSDPENDPEAFDDNVAKEFIIEKNDSILCTSMSSINISIDNLFLTKDEHGNYVKNEDGKTYKTGQISDGDYFCLVINLETLDDNENRYVQLSYKFVYEKPIIPDESNDPLDPTPGGDDSSVPFDDSSINDGTNFKYSVESISDRKYARYAFINACSLETLYNLPNATLESYDPMCRIYISPLCPKEFNFTLRITEIGDDGSIVKNVLKTFTYDPNKNHTNIESPTLDRCVNMNRPDVSYSLLRTNPKLTGNIKVVIDSKSNIYLDTFKISNVLSDKKYRHIKVGYDSYYGNSIMKYFKDVPTSELYKIEDRCYDIFTTYKTFDKQFYDVYNYGVKTNDDKLYSENYALFAPLCVKRVLPDFFLIFRVDKNVDSFDEETMTDKEKINFFIKNGVIVKSFDMRQNSKLGTYIRNVYEHSKSYVGDIFVSYEKDNYNKFLGISLDKGAVTQIYESVYSEKYINNQVQMNEFYSSGFERNHIVSKNILNFEFLFNDESQDLFSINTYFGLYVKVNEEANTFSCIGNDENGNYVFDIEGIHSFPVKTELNKTNLSNIIYGLTTYDDFIRLNGSIYDSSVSSVIDNFKLKPLRSVLNTSLSTVKTKYKSYIHLTVNSLFNIGEHYRIIDKTENTIYEVIIGELNDSNKGTYLDNHNLSDVTTNYYRYLNTRYTLKRICLYVQHPYEIQEFLDSLDDDYIYVSDLKTYNDYVNDEAEQLFYAFRKFGANDRFVSYKLLNNVMSLCSYDDNMIFEKICSKSGFTNEDNTYVLNSDDEQNNLTFFGSINPKKTILYVSNTMWQHKPYSYLYPIDFEVLGNRMAYICGFLNISTIIDDTDILYETHIADEHIFDKTLLYVDTDNNSKLYDGVSLNLFSNSNSNADVDEYYENISLNAIKFKNIKSYNNLNYNLLNLKSPILKNNAFSLYTAYPLNAGICSIFQIKDYDFDILDNRKNLLYDNSPVGAAGEFAETTFFNNISKIKDNEDIGNDSNVDNDSLLKDSSIFGNDIIIYENASDVFDSSLPISSKTEENLYDYIIDDITDASTYDKPISNVLSKKYSSTNRLSYSPFLTQYICKWKSIGTDSRIKDMRIMYDTSIHGDSYFVVNDTKNNSLVDSSVDMDKANYDMYLGVLCEKTINNADPLLKHKYITNSLDDTVINDDYQNYVKDSLLKDKLSFDDILNNKDSFVNKLSLVYNSGINSIEFISGGIKFKISSTNEHIIDLSKYNGYTAAFINMPYNSLSKSKSELFIDEITKEITLVWYSNCALLNYGVKYDSAHKIKNSYNLFNNLIETRLNYKNSISDVKLTTLKNNQISNNIYALLDYDKHEANSLLQSDNEYTAYVVLSNINVDVSTNYTKYVPVVLTGKLETLKEYFELYPNKLCLRNPFIWRNDGIISEDINSLASNFLLDYYTNDMLECTESLLYTNSVKNIESNIRTSDDLKTDLQHCNVFIKTSNGLYDYSSLSLLTVSIVNPILYTIENRPGHWKSESDKDFNETPKGIYVQSTYGEPVMKDVLSFNYNISSDDNAEYNISISTLNKTFGKSFNSANITIYSINTLSQQWFNKISDENDYYCLRDSDNKEKTYFRFAYDVRHNVSVINDMWYNSIFRKYSLQKNTKNKNNEIYSKVKGYTIGYELKSFLNSKGVIVSHDNKNTESIEITLWKNTTISNSNNYIQLDISESLLYYILYSDGFNKSWNKLKLKNNDYKMKYIKNYILNFITIDNNCKFELRKTNTLLKSYNFISEYTEDDTEICSNYKNEIKYENGKYYMYIYPNDRCTYYAKMTINI